MQDAENWYSGESCSILWEQSQTEVTRMRRIGLWRKPKRENNYYTSEFLLDISINCPSFVLLFVSITCLCDFFKSSIPELIRMSSLPDKTCPDRFANEACSVDYRLCKDENHGMFLIFGYQILCYLQPTSGCTALHLNWLSRWRFQDSPSYDVGATRHSGNGDATTRWSQ